MAVENETPTVERSLGLLSEALGKAAEDLRAAQTTIDRLHADIATRNTSLSRSLITDAERVIDHLRQTDEALRDVVKGLEAR